MAKPHTVAIVANRDFGRELEVLARRMHVWVCATPSNVKTARRIWAARGEGEYDLDSGVTTFDVGASDTSETMVLDILDTIDAHHNEFSHDPAWTCIDVYGASLSPTIKAALQELGVTEFEPRNDGFACRRGLSDV